MVRKIARHWYKVQKKCTMFLSTSSCIFPHDYEAQAAEKAVAQVHRVAITVADPPPYVWLYMLHLLPLLEQA